MLHFKYTKGDIWLGAGAIGIMAATLLRLILGIPAWSLGLSTVLWWAAMCTAGWSLWIGVCKTTC